VWPVEYFLFIGHRCFRTATDISERECSKKFAQQGRSRFDARSVLPYVSASGAKRQVCEPEGQAKCRLCLCEPPRQSQGTPLAAFFNIPLCGLHEGHARRLFSCKLVWVVPVLNQM